MTRTSAVTPAPVLRVLVTNDDGVHARGIDALARGLRTLPGVKVTVVAPAHNRSGTGARATTGPVRRTKDRTLSGLPATAVQGYPADAVNVALGELGLHPHLVVAGVNRGLNTGSAVPISGTVGAARTAITHGVPAIAASAQRTRTGGRPDYAVAVRQVKRWVTAHRDALLAGQIGTRTLLSLNTPTCARGKVRGVAKVVTARGDVRAGASNCLSRRPRPRTDVVAIERGFIASSRVPAVLAPPSR